MKYIRNDIKQDESLLLVDIDDPTLNYLKYRWPIPRDFFGDAVEVMGLFGTKAVVYDIEFLQESVPSVNMDTFNDIKSNINDKFNEAVINYKSLTTIIANDPSAKKALKSRWDIFEKMMAQTSSSLNYQIDSIVKDNDEYFGKRLNFFGNAFGTVNMLYITDNSSDSEIDQKEMAYLKKYGIDEKLLLLNKKSHPAIKHANISEFPTDKVLNSFKGIGFTYINKDKDAVIRSISLFMERGGYVIPQLSIRPFIDLYNIKPEQIDFSDDNFVKFKNVIINGKSKNINIPLYKGSMLINWPRGEFGNVFTNKEFKEDGRYYHLSFAKLIYFKRLLGDVQNNLNGLATIKDASVDFSSLLVDYTGLLNQIEQLAVSSKSDDILRTSLDMALTEVMDKILEQNQILAHNLTIEVEKLKQHNKIDELKTYDDVISVNNNNIDVINEIQSLREYFKKSLKDKICFIGWTSTGTTDLGATPMTKKFENVGIHPTILNTILQNSFISIFPVWIIYFLSLLLFSLGIWIIIKREAVFIAIYGSLSIIGILLFIILFYKITNIYISPVIPFVYGFISFLSIIILKFILTEKEKSFIRNAFTMYLSPEVIKEIIKDPAKLKLGGERRNCTAIFTDIEGFSTISEEFQDDPPGLVKLLNQYLSEMSDIILENRGTIDKYEGDAIIGFYGAPHDMADHALMACISALNIKKVEAKLNKLFMEQGVITKPLYTRIGINTGDMFVGNMGTTTKFNYTMMGHAVNLASRIEGVNKLYGTYILITENTHQFVKEKIICRKLDRVKVININTPIRLYEPICTEEELDDNIVKKLEAFHRGLKIFEEQNWDLARKAFIDSLDNTFWDKTVNLYIERCNNFIKTPPSKTWDGVYNMSMK